ncbi:hypothetical protein HJFPF1_08651 [Paramyrothecium foliicola]|nr:hypothetical protein HJFPF1_08651 [Paramyrothecium foliicola]
METLGSLAGDEFRVQGATQDNDFPPGSEMRANHPAYKTAQKKSDEVNQTYEWRAQHLFANSRDTDCAHIIFGNPVSFFVQ